MAGVAINSDLAPDVASAARAAAERIRVRISRTAADIVAIGLDLIEIRKALGDSGFQLWIEAEFDMSRSTAYNFMSVAKRFGDSPTVGLLPPAVLYALAARSTPDDVRDEVLSLAASGETVDVKTVAKLKERLKARKKQVKKAREDADIAEARARDLIAQQSKADNELMFLRQRVELQADEIERLKQPNTLHVYPSESETVSHLPPKRGRCLETLAELIADRFHGDIAELVSLAREEGMFAFAQALEAASAASEAA